MAKLFRLVVDTNSYAGNFERILCAYATGQTGECGVGVDYSQCFSEQIAHIEWWNKHIVKRSEGRHESPCKRPTTIYWNGKQGGYKSVAIYVKKMPPEEVLIEFAERVKEFCNNRDLLKATVHNMDIKLPNKAMLLSLMGLESKPIDLSTVVEDEKNRIVFDGIRIFEGVKDEVLVSEISYCDNSV